MANSKGDIRDDVLRRVRCGEMSTHTAEKWAKENDEIFTQEPDPTDFDPMTELEWTLPMVAAWIIDRSSDSVRFEWDKFRNERINWRFCESVSPSGQRQSGCELRRDEPRTLFEVFAPDGEFMYERLADELAYALRSKLLPAKGSAGGARDSIPSVSWKGPFTLDELARRDDAIYAVAKMPDELGDDIEVYYYSDITVSQESVLGIWIPVTPLSPGGVSGDQKRAPPPRLAATLPPRFDWPDWTLEHVLAWVALRDMSQLRSLELADQGRPKFLGRRCRTGLVDQQSENYLREALINKKLIGMKG